MITIGTKGTFESVPEVAMMILNNDIDGISLQIKNGFNINEPIPLSIHTQALPIELALIKNNIEMILLLIEHGVNLNDTNYPAITIAAQYCDTNILRFLVKAGAKIDAVNGIKSNAFRIALFNKRYELLPVLMELGLNMDTHGGVAFRCAVDDGDYMAIEFFIEMGVDINFHESSILFPTEPTPIIVAAENNDFDMVMYLVDKGADITICDKHGYTPYTVALKNNNLEMAEYLKAIAPKEVFYEEQQILEISKASNKEFNIIDETKSSIKNLETLKLQEECFSENIAPVESILSTKDIITSSEINYEDNMDIIEPKKLDSKEERIEEFKKHKMPQILINFLLGNMVRLRFSEESNVKFIEFFSIMDVRKIIWSGEPVYMLIKELDLYPDVKIVWYPKGKCISYLNIELNIFRKLDCWSKFIKNPEFYINRILNGYYVTK